MPSVDSSKIEICRQCAELSWEEIKLNADLSKTETGKQNAEHKQIESPTSKRNQVTKDLYAKSSIIKIFELLTGVAAQLVLGSIFTVVLFLTVHWIAGIVVAALTILSATATYLAFKN